MDQSSWGRRIAGAVILMGVLGGAGCGLARRGQGNGAASDNQGLQAADASALNLRIVPAGDDAAYPDRGFDFASQRGPDKATVQGPEMTFEGNILLSGKPLFFVWEEKALGAPIIEATADHRIVDLMNRPQGEVKRLDVLQDPDTHRWYLPLREVFQDQEGDEDAEIRHVLMLSMVQEGGKRQEFMLNFRAVGSIPAVHAEVLTPGLLSDPGSSAAYIAGHGLELPDLALANPAKRPLKIWVRITEVEAAMTAVTLYNSQFLARPDAAPVGPSISAFRSDASWTLDRVYIQRHAAGASELRQIHAGTWFGVLLGASESLMLRPAAIPREAARCALPATVNQMFGWTTSETHWTSHGGEATRDVPHSETHPNSWTIAGLHATGKWGLEVRVADPQTAESDALGNVASLPEERREFFRPVLTTPMETSYDLGARPDGLGAFSCQGIFSSGA